MSDRGGTAVSHEEGQPDERIVIDVHDAVPLTPWSLTTLRRLARQPGSPWVKIGGKWVTTPEDLQAWVRSGAAAGHDSRQPGGDPMLKPRRGEPRPGSFAAMVKQHEEAA